MAIDELGELFGKDLDDDEVDTVGGFLAKHLGKIPSVGNSVEVDGILLVAERMEASRNRVSHVIASTTEAAENDSTAENGSTDSNTPTEAQERS